MTAEKKLRPSKIKKPHSKFRRRKMIYMYIFLAPAIIWFLWLMAYPMLMSLYMSLCKWNMLGYQAFVGLKNYVNLFTSNPNFYPALGFTALYAVPSIFVVMLFALLLGVMLSSERKSTGVLRTAFYLPCIIAGGTQTTVMWYYVLGMHGIFNSFFGYFGLPPVNFFVGGNLMVSAIFISMWGAGSMMIFFVAGFKNIPVDYYEAAEIDGAGAFRKMFRISLPMLSPIILYNLIMGIIGSFQQFQLGYVFQSFHVNFNLYALSIYNMAFKNNSFGNASAMAFVLFAIVLVLTIVIFKFSGRAVFYGDESGK